MDSKTIVFFGKANKMSGISILFMLYFRDLRVALKLFELKVIVDKTMF